MNEVASSLAFGLTPLAILPSGSGNGLATDLGVSRQADRAMVESLRAEPRAIDAGELGGRLFFSIAGIGFDAHVASLFDRGVGPVAWIGRLRAHHLPRALEIPACDVHDWG